MFVVCLKLHSKKKAKKSVNVSSWEETMGTGQPPYPSVHAWIIKWAFGWLNPARWTYNIKE